MEQTGLSHEAEYCLKTLNKILCEEYNEPCRREQLDKKLRFIMGKLEEFISSYKAVKSIVVNLQLNEADKRKLICELKDCKKSNRIAYDYANNINSVWNPDLNRYADSVNKLYTQQQSIASQMKLLIDRIRNTK
jgi:hypothetical protein